MTVPISGLDLPSASAERQAYGFLRERILSGAFEGGRRLATEEIARELGLSRMPVREALRQLAAEGLVTVLPNRGARVTMLSPGQVAELFEIRAVLEGLTLRHARTNLRPFHLEELEFLMRRLNGMRDDPVPWLQHHAAFHGFLDRLAGRPRLAQEAERMRASLQPYTAMYLANIPKAHLAGHNHEALLDLLRGDASPAELEQAGRDHVLLTGENVIHFLRDAEQRLRRPAEVEVAL